MQRILRNEANSARRVEVRMGNGAGKGLPQQGLACETNPISGARGPGDGRLASFIQTQGDCDYPPEASGDMLEAWQGRSRKTIETARRPTRCGCSARSTGRCRPIARSRWSSSPTGPVSSRLRSVTRRVFSWAWRERASRTVIDPISSVLLVIVSLSHLQRLSKQSQ